jgi:alcohol dehydrogenase, propanol-preferring
MLSFDVVEHGKPLQIQLRETPKPGGKEVLVRITHAGLCHSDIHVWDGYFDLGGGKKALLSERGIKPPFTLGHEPLGVVTACGEDAEGVNVGERCLVFPWIGCGECWACEADLDNLCPRQRSIGIGRPGAFSTHLLVPDAKFLVNVDGLPDEVAAPLACAGLTSYAAVNKLPEIFPGDWVAVIGCGGVGMAAVSILKARGIDNIVALDVDDKKLQAASQLGARWAMRTDAENIAVDLSSMTQGRLAGAIDFVGVPSTFATAYPALRKGGTFVLVGLHGGELTTPLPPIAQRQVAIVGSFVGSVAELRATVKLAQSGKLVPPPATIRNAKEINDAFCELAEGRVVGRTVLDFSSLTMESESV